MFVENDVVTTASCLGSQNNAMDKIDTCTLQYLSLPKRATNKRKNYFNELASCVWGDYTVNGKITVSLFTIDRFILKSLCECQ